MSSYTDKLQYTYTDVVDIWGNRIFVIDKSFNFYSGSKERPLLTVNIPGGFLTDLASVPWPLSLIFSPEGEYAQAAVVHDYIIDNYYKHDYISRVTADGIFLEAMLVLGVNRIKATAIYLAVRVYGNYKYWTTRNQNDVH